VLTSPLTITIATNTTTAANPLVIQKFGSGANPLLTAHTGAGTLDGMVIINGADYVTIDGIDLQENATNVTTTTQIEWGYALLKTGASNGAQNNTIKNVTVTLNKANTASVGIYLGNHTTASATALTISSIPGNSSFNRFFNNTITNCYGGYSITGYGAAAPYDFYDQGNQIGVDGVSTRRSQVTNFGGAATTANGVFAANQNGLKIFKTYINSNGGVNSTGTMNGISTVTGTNSNIDIYNDTIVLAAASTTGSTVVGINNTMGGTGAGNNVNIYNNVVDGCTYTTNTSGIFRGVVSTATASYTNIYNNKVTNNSIPGTGEFAAIYYGGSSVNICLNVNINDNVVSGNTKTGTAGIFYMIYASASTVATNIYNNQLYNNSATASNGGMYGYYNFGFGLLENIYNNTIYNNAGGSGDVVMLHVRSGSAPTNKEVYGNTIYNISGNTTANFAGIWVDYGTISNVYKNNIYNLTNNSATGSGTGGVFGILMGTNVNTVSNIYNNFISDLKAPVMSNVTAIVGIFATGSASSTVNLYHNTVYVNASSSGANFGTLAINCAVAPVSIDLRNNILVNVCTPAGTGLTRALGRSSTALTNSALTSGYNCLYAGVPGPSNLLYWDGTNSVQTIVALRNLVGPREQSSFTTLPPFVNVAVAPYDLHLQASIATQCEGGGYVVAGYTTDYDGNTRNATTPDVGADEITGITTDIAGPNIQYTLLTNSSVAATRTLTSFATVTDPSGINTTAGIRPRIYYKRSTNANTYNTNTNATDGWKYVEASNTSSPFNFTIDYSLLFGGGVVAGDVIQYFVVAQDLAGTPIVGWNNGGMSTTPTSVNLSAANFPLNNTINQYTIVAAALSGVVNVGPTETITSLTNAGGIFQAINASTLSGNLTINITGDLTAETGTFALNQWAEEGVGNYTVTIVPSAAVVRNITGSNAGSSLIRFDGADRVTIDGRFAGTGSYLRFLNTSNAAPTIGFINDAQNNTVRNSIIESGNTSTSTTLGGAVIFGTTTGANGNDNNTINLCELRDRSDVAGTPAMLINIVGTNTTLNQYNNNIAITNNNLHDWFLANSASQFAISIGTGTSGTTISGNSFYQTAARTNTVSGAITRAININFSAPVNSNGGFTITNNFIGGSAPGATGTDWIVTVSGVGVTQTFSAITLVSGMIPNSIQGNVIRKIDYTTNAPTASITMWNAISLGQGIHNVGNLTGNTIGDATGLDHIKITINAGGGFNAFLAGILAGTANGSYNIQNNTIAGITIAGTATTNIIPQWIQIQGSPSAATTCSNNLIGSTTTANSIRNLAAAAPYVSFGIRQVISSGAALNCSNNTIQNLTDYSTSSASVNYGILLISSVGGQGTLNVTDNTIRDLSTAVGSATPAILNTGISCQNMASTTHNISGNNISGLTLSNTGFFAGYTCGIQVQGNSFGGVMSRNNISGLVNANTGPATGMGGIYLSSGLSWTISNNMISLSNGSSTNNIDLTGIADVMGSGATGNFYYNSIYLSGSTTGANNTYPYVRYANPTSTLRNNLLVNNRSGGTGSHVAIGNTSAVPVPGWGANASNNNAFVVGDSTKVGVWISTAVNLVSLRSLSGNEANSIRTNTATVTPTALFVSASDLHINTSTYPAGMGTPVAGITTDYDNTTRSATAPTIGADEIPCPALALSVSSQTNPLCNGGTGSATVAATGGTGYAYNWLPSGGTAATATGLSAGTYTVNITNTCGNNNSITVTITQPAVIAVTSTQTNVTCNAAANGSASVNVSGGTPGYTYSWAPSGGTAATASGLAAGTYTCTITDANGCTLNRSVTITQPAVLAVTPASQTNVLCFGGNTGDATVSVSGGTMSYSYNWLPSGGTAATASGLTAGTYTCNVTDANGCNASQSFTITQPSSGLAVSSTSTSVLCNGGMATVTIIASGGAAPYSGDSTYMVGAGTYTFPVTDANGCMDSTTVVITEPTALTLVSSPSNITCNGANDGSVDLTTSGGTTPYSFSWNSGMYITEDISGLTPGSYTGVVTDTNGCQDSVTVVISEPAALTSTLSATPSVVCNNDSVTVATSVSGGTTPYSYSWIPSGNTSSSFTTLLAMSTTFVVTVTDSMGCTLNDTIAIGVGNPSVNLGNDTALCALSFVLDAGSGYSYVWQDNSTMQTFSAAATGVYYVTVTDTVGCTATDSISVTINSALNVALGSDSSNCNGSPVTLDAGAFNNAQYMWQDSTTAQILLASNSGMYYVTVTDTMNGCVGSDTINVSINTSPMVSLTGGSFCPGGNLTLNAGNSGAIYLWSDSSTAQTLMVSAGGTYWVTVTDPVSGCSTTDSATVTVSASPNNTVTSSNWGGTLTSNAPAPATYWWFNCQDSTIIISSSMQSYTPNANGTYAVIVTLNGCQDTSACINVTNVGIEDNDVVNIGIYPNPNDGTFNVMTSSISDMMIYDAQGKLVAAQKVQANVQNQINIESSGMYLITIVSADGSRTTQRVVVTK